MLRFPASLLLSVPTRATSALGSAFAGSRRTLRRSGSALLVLLSVIASSAALLPDAALAIGPAVVGVSITPVTATGDPLTTFGHVAVAGTDALRYRVSYSCAVVACTNTTVTLPPSGLDPTYNQFRLLAPVPTAWTAPFTGATISGSADAGVTVKLGDLPAGSSGTFVVVYGQNRPRFYTIHNEIQPAAYFPPGYQIQMSATISSDNSTVPGTGDAEPVTWAIQVPDNPGIAKAGPGDVRADEEVTYSIFMNSGCFTQAGSGHVTAPGRVLCAREFTVVEHLPAEAVYVSSSDDGVYDPAAHTVTWSVSGPEAAGGFGRSGTCCWSPTREYHPRTVTVVYPADRFPAGAGGADFEAPVTNRVTVDMTYLDGSTGSAEAQRTHLVARYAPFPKATFSYKASSNSGSDGTVHLVQVPPDVTGDSCPSSGQDDWGRSCTPGGPVAPFGPNVYYWRHVTYNQANVAGVAVIEDDVDHPGTEVYQVWTNPGGAQVEYTLDDGTTGTGATHPTSLNLVAPPGRRFVRVRVTSPVLPGPNARPNGTAATSFDVRFYYRVPVSAPIGAERTNSIAARMTYPDHPQLPDITNAASPHQSRTIRFVATPGVAPGFSAELLSPTVEGGGLAVPGRNVTFRLRGRTGSVPGTSDITPQYVFVAPAGWTITPGSASFPPQSVPAGVTFRYRTVTVNGEARPAVVASWPNTVSFGRNAYWPVMSVVAQPTSAVPAGTTSTAAAYIGDSRHTWGNTEARYNNGYQDAADLDGDGVSTEWFSAVAQNIAVSSSDALSAIKEICQPDAGAPDGCQWISNPDIVVGVAPSAADIRYRITLLNSGNTQLGNVVGYDVLPHRDDRGTSAGTAEAQRGSTVGLSLGAVSQVPAGLQLAYSRSVNPCREEVYPSAPGCDPDWTAPLGGAAAIRMTYDGTLAPGQRISFVYDAALQPGAPADALACNSVAVASNRTLPTEPRSVCATTQEADLELSVPDRLPLQVGRPGVVPFVVDNHGGSPRSAATATIGIPAGVTVINLTPSGWRCRPDGTHPDGTAVGPTTLTCEAVTDTGTLREVPAGTAEPLSLDVRPDPSLAGQTVCFDGLVSGPMFDPDRENNDARACFAVSAPAAALRIDKTDDRLVVAPNDEYTYTITVTNQLVGETVRGATVVDTLPPGVVFVSATMGGSHEGAGPADVFGNTPGGTVTWTLPDLAPAGTATAGGAGTDGNPGSSAVVAVTVRVVPGATGDVVNAARTDAPDPADPGGRLCPDASCFARDVDRLRALRVTKSSNGDPVGVRAGDEIVYTVTVTSTGTADHTTADPAAIYDDLSGVLDEARFVAGSARVSVDGRAPVPVPDPSDNVIRWSGALAAGRSAVLTYRVVADSRDGDGRLLNSAFVAPPTSCDAATGTDTGRRSCASHVLAFATTLLKSVASARQSDDGRWEVVYQVDVTNLVDDAPARYDLVDELRFGDGIDVISATLSDAPAGVTPASPAWDGRVNTAVATGVELPPGGHHRYTVTVVADAWDEAGTPAGLCQVDGPGAFGNAAAITSGESGERHTSFACTAPPIPAVSKTVVGDPTQNSDGSWTTAYRIVVSNTATAPSDGLVYSLRDVFDLPSGVRLTGVSVAGPDGVALNPAFNGGQAMMAGAAVTADANLLSRPDRVPAAAGTVPGTRTFDVTVVTEVPAGAVSETDLACGPDGGGGYVNTATVEPGRSTATACAPITAEPPPVLGKRITSSSIGEDGRWTLTYDVVVTNPSPSVAGRYDLTDELQFGAGITVVEAELVRPEGVSPATPAWNGTTAVAVARRVLLSGGATHLYTVRVVADAGDVTDDPAGDRAADCRLTETETGTGFRNVAGLTAGAAPPQTAVACDMAAESSVSKVADGPPVQNADGTWTLTYRLTVRNRATSSGPLSYSLTDRFRFPAAVKVIGVETDGPEEGGRLNPGFNGGLDALGGRRVRPDTSLLETGAIAAASDPNVPSETVYGVRVTVDIPAGLSVGDMVCDARQDADGGGFVNEAAVRFGSDRVREAEACVPVPEVPVARIAKVVRDAALQPDGRMVVEYGIEVTNPSSDVATRYRLEDRFALGDGISVVGASVLESPPTAAVSRSWDGKSERTLAEDVLLPGGAVHRYRVRLTADPGPIGSSPAAGDCTLEGHEAGTGFRNIATATSGLAPSAVAHACTGAVIVKGIQADRESSIVGNPLRLLPDTGRDFSALLGTGLIVLAAGRLTSRLSRHVHRRRT